MEDYKVKPKGFEDDVSDYCVLGKDISCGEPVSWGFRIKRRLGKARFEELQGNENLKCVEAGDWIILRKILTRNEAITKYGEITNEEFSNGKFVSITFGSKRFTSDTLNPNRKVRLLIKLGETIEQAQIRHNKEMELGLI